MEVCANSQSYTWIALQVRTGQESLVAGNLEYHLKSSGFDHMVERVYVAVRKIVKITKLSLPHEKPILPGYLLVRCRMTTHLWHVLRRCPGVYKIIEGFISEEEIVRVEKHCFDQCELSMPDQQTLKRLLNKFKEIIYTKRNKKPVIRLPLVIVTLLWDGLDRGLDRLNEQSLIQKMLNSVKLAV